MYASPCFGFHVSDDGSLIPGFLQKRIRELTLKFQCQFCLWNDSRQTTMPSASSERMPIRFRLMVFRSTNVFLFSGPIWPTFQCPVKSRFETINLLSRRKLNVTSVFFLCCKSKKQKSDIYNWCYLRFEERQRVSLIFFFWINKSMKKKKKKLSPLFGPQILKHTIPYPVLNSVEVEILITFLDVVTISLHFGFSKGVICVTVVIIKIVFSYTAPKRKIRAWKMNDCFFFCYKFIKNPNF